MGHTAMDTIRTAIVGVGHFGRKHAEKYAAMPDVDLVAVADVNSHRATEVASACGTRAVTDYQELLGLVDAVSVVVPTAIHYDVARFFLDNGIHVLVEKPITRGLAQADDLIQSARQHDLILQVGHLERFFAMQIGLQDTILQPLYVEALRIAPFQPRGTDVSVVLDLMIHDIDLIASLVPAPITRVDAIGAPVLSDQEDIVNTRLEFANGCVASITASRIAFRSERKLRFFQPDCMTTVDLIKRHVATVRKTDGVASPESFVTGAGNFSIEEHEIADGDPLGAEIAAFISAVANGTEPVVSGEDGRQALDTAIRITDSLQSHLAKVRANLIRTPDAAA